jgi:multicomponent Na+:H+ antiporter subunit D
MHHIVVKANLFFISGLAHGYRGTSSLRRAGRVCLWTATPLTCGLFLVAALSLAGIPPLSGFFAKFLLVKAGLQAEAWLIVAVAVVVGLLTLFSMTKIWAEAFWKGPDENPREQREARAERQSRADTPPTRLMVLTCAGLALLTVLIGIFAGPVFELAERAAGQLLDNESYIRAVLGPEAMR